MSTAVRTLCVVPRAQGRGLGKALLQRLEEELRDTGTIGISLFTQRSIPAKAFYEGNGFEIVPTDVRMGKLLDRARTQPVEDSS